jgi:hypothetical protein
VALSPKRSCSHKCVLSVTGNWAEYRLPYTSYFSGNHLLSPWVEPLGKSNPIFVYLSYNRNQKTFSLPVSLETWMLCHSDTGSYALRSQFTPHYTPHQAPHRSQLFFDAQEMVVFLPFLQALLKENVGATHFQTRQCSYQMNGILWNLSSSLISAYPFFLPLIWNRSILSISSPVL